MGILSHLATSNQPTSRSRKNGTLKPCLIPFHPDAEIFAITYAVAADPHGHATTYVLESELPAWLEVLHENSYTEIYTIDPYSGHPIPIPDNTVISASGSTTAFKDIFSTPVSFHRPSSTPETTTQGYPYVQILDSDWL